MCQLALPIKKTNYHHVQAVAFEPFVATPPVELDGCTYPVLVNDVDNGHQTSLQGTGGGLGNATSLYESLERLQVGKIMRTMKCNTSCQSARCSCCCSTT